MRTLMLSLLFAGLLIPGADAMSQDSNSQAASKPTPEQLLHVPVGGTHIPVQNNPQHYTNPYANDDAAITQGHKLFTGMNCVGCHAAEGGGGMGPPLSDTHWIYGNRPDQMFLTIMQGRPNGMPAFGSILPEDSIWKIVAYINTLSATKAKRSEQDQQNQAE
ncbi:MAG TPA: c-type cytochrome [Methylophilaceae bacterium]|nr:c-type cytochrome [Methylophilaceae bacterium]